MDKVKLVELIKDASETINRADVTNETLRDYSNDSYDSASVEFTHAVQFLVENTKHYGYFRGFSESDEKYFNEALAKATLEMAKAILADYYARNGLGKN